MTVKRLAMVLVVVGMLGAMTAGAAAAEAAECDVSYTATGGKWSEASSWQGGELPTSAQNVCIPPGHGTVVVPFQFKAEANRVRAESPLFIELAGQLKLADATPGAPDASYFVDAKIHGKLSTAGKPADLQRRHPARRCRCRCRTSERDSFGTPRLRDPRRRRAVRHPVRQRRRGRRAGGRRQRGHFPLPARLHADGRRDAHARRRRAGPNSTTSKVAASRETPSPAPSMCC